MTQIFAFNNLLLSSAISHNESCLLIVREVRMLNKIWQFFSSLAEEPTQEEAPLNIEVACAVLLFEEVKADGKLIHEE